MDMVSNRHTRIDLLSLLDAYIKRGAHAGPMSISQAKRISECRGNPHLLFPCSQELMTGSDTRDIEGLRPQVQAGTPQACNYICCTTVRMNSFRTSWDHYLRSFVHACHYLLHDPSLIMLTYATMT